MHAGSFVLPACFAAWIDFFVLLIVTIVEVHVLIFDVCVYKKYRNSKGFVNKIILNSFIIVCQLKLYSNFTSIK